MDNLGSAARGVVVLSAFLGAFVFWVWSLVDAVRAGSKVVWVLVIVFAGFFGSIAYVVAGRRRPA